MIRKKRSRAARGERLDRGKRQPSIYSRTEQDPEGKNFKKTFLVFVLILLVGGIVYLAIFSPIFNIRSVTLNDTKYVSRDSILNIINDYKKGGFIREDTLTFPSGELKKKILDLPGIEAVSITKKYPNTIVIQVEERVPIFIWQESNQKYLVDKTGIIYANYDDRFKDIPIVIDTNNLPTTIGKYPVSSGFSSFVGDINKNFATMTDEKISRMEVADTTSELKVYTSSWYAYFDTTRSATDEINNLVRILDTTKSKKENVEYVDLRISDKIFYKLK